MNAIITAATGYTESDIKVFLESVKKNCPDVKLFLIIYKKDSVNIENLRDKYQFIEPICVREKITKRFGRIFAWAAQLLKRVDHEKLPLPLKILGTYSLHIIVERYYIGSKILKEHSGTFSNILLTDCRDVVIQKDPFELINSELISGIESKVIKDESINSNWIRSIYGETVLNHIQSNRIVCAGVTLGPATLVQKYLDDICDEMWVNLPQVIRLRIGGDQAVHNYMIHEKKIPIKLADNHGRILATIGFEADSISIDSTSNLVKVNEIAPAIIHQYDRHPDLAVFFKKKYS